MKIKKILTILMCAITSLCLISCDVTMRDDNKNNNPNVSEGKDFTFEYIYEDKTYSVTIPIQGNQADVVFASDYLSEELVELLAKKGLKLSLLYFSSEMKEFDTIQSNPIINLSDYPEGKIKLWCTTSYEPDYWGKKLVNAYKNFKYDKSFTYSHYGEYTGREVTYLSFDAKTNIVKGSVLDKFIPNEEYLVDENGKNYYTFELTWNLSTGEFTYLTVSKAEYLENGDNSNFIKVVSKGTPTWAGIKKEIELQFCFDMIFVDEPEFKSGKWVNENEFSVKDASGKVEFTILNMNDTNKQTIITSRYNINDVTENGNPNEVNMKHWKLVFDKV